MASRLKQILASGNVNPGATAVLAHTLNINGRALVPDEVTFDNPDFDCTAATSSTVTVINRGVGAASSNVLIVHDHTILREYGGVQNTDLSPQPFVIRGGTSSTSTGGIQAFRYTCTGAEGSDFTVTLPVAQANDSYAVVPGLAGVTSIYGIDCPDILAGDRTTTQFRVVTTAAVTAGDQIDFLVTAL